MLRNISERYLNITLTRENNITTGKIYLHVIERERKGDYLGKTVQVVPHLTDAVQDWIERVARIPVDDTHEEPDVCIIELGGTVGDIESGPFIEAMRQLRRRVGKDNFLQIHVSLVPGKMMQIRPNWGTFTNHETNKSSTTNKRRSLPKRLFGMSRVPA